MDVKSTKKAIEEEHNINYKDEYEDCCNSDYYIHISYKGQI